MCNENILNSNNIWLTFKDTIKRNKIPLKK